VRDVAGLTPAEREAAARRTGEVQGEGGSSRVVDVTPPRQVLEDVRRTAPEFAIRCPFCATILRADNDRELGKGLKDHWGDAHHIRPTIRAEMGMARAR